MRLRSLLLVLVALPAAALAQHAGHGARAPYAGFGAREVAGLPAAEVADLRAGRGMGLALLAEVNGYPGPLHALELADALSLSPSQRETMARLMDAMRRDAVPLGERVIAAERALDRVFAGGAATEPAIVEATREAALARAALRAAHLRVHLAAREAMSEGQRAAYARLRGYAPG